MLSPKSLCALTLAVAFSCLYLMQWSHATCSTQTSCEDCLMASPAWTFWAEGDYCKFCPRPALTHRFPFDDEARSLPAELSGACFDNASGDDRAKDTVTKPAPVLGGCGLTSGQTTWAANGWLVPGKNASHAKDKSTRIRTLEEVKRICETVRRMYAPSAPSGGSGSSSGRTTGGPSESASSSGASAKLSSSLLMSNSEETNALRIASHVAAQVRRDLLLALKLRAVDPHFFYETFPDADLADQLAQRYAWKSTTTAVKLLVPYASYVIDGAGAIGALHELLQERAERIMYFGGKANTYSFPEVNYATLFQAYTYVLRALKVEASGGTVSFQAAKTLLSKLKAEADEHLSSSAVAARNVASATHKVNSHPATTGIKITAHVLAAIFSGGISLPVSAGIAVGEMVLDSSLEGIAEHSTRDKLRILVGSEYNLEGAQEGYFVLDKTAENIFPQEKFVQGPFFCDVTNYDAPNHGCAAGLRCVRSQGAFFPLHTDVYKRSYQTSRGHCAPVDSVQLGVGAPCVLDIDCFTGFCDTGSIEFNVTISGRAQTVRLSSGNRAFRGDMAVDVPYYHTKLTAEQRITATHGFCRLAAKPDTAGCEVIAPDMKFWKCKDTPIPARFFDAAPVPKKPTRSVSDDGLAPKRTDSGLKRSSSLSSLQPNV